MSSSNRSAIYAKLHKSLKKHPQYKSVSPPDRPLLEQLLYACCLENSSYDAADEAIAKLQEMFFNWNEVRVTTVAELAEVMSSLTDPRESAARLKNALQSVFEAHYSFEIDFLKKQGQGKVLKEFEKLKCATPFGMAFVTQQGLGGHAIPLNRAALDLLCVLDAITDSNASKNQAPGLERAVPKNKGVEFSSLLHQFSLEYGVSPNSQRVKSILAEVDPGAKDRLAARQAAAKEKARQEAEAAKQTLKAEKEKAKTKTKAKRDAKTKPPAESVEPDRAEGGKKGASKKADPAPKKSPTAKPASADDHAAEPESAKKNASESNKRTDKKASAKRKTAPGKKTSSPAERGAPEKKKTSPGKKTSSGRKTSSPSAGEPPSKSPTKRLSKKKPR